MSIINLTTSAATWEQVYSQGSGETNWTRVQPELSVGTDAKQIALDSGSIVSSGGVVQTVKIINEGHNLLGGPRTFYLANAAGSVAVLPAQLFITESAFSTIVDTQIPLTSRLGVTGSFTIPFNRMMFSLDGKRLFTYNINYSSLDSTLTAFTITQYSLSTAWTPTTASFVGTYTLPSSASAMERFKFGIRFGRNGKTFLLAFATTASFSSSSPVTANVQEFVLNKPYDFSSGFTTTAAKTWTFSLGSYSASTSGFNNPSNPVKSFDINENAVVLASNYDGFAGSSGQLSVAWTAAISDWDIGTAGSPTSSYVSPLGSGGNGDMMTTAVRLVKGTTQVPANILFMSSSEGATDRTLKRRTLTNATIADHIGWLAAAIENRTMSNYSDFCLSSDWRTVFLTRANTIEFFQTTAASYTTIDLNVGSLGFPTSAPPVQAFLIEDAPTLTLEQVVQNDKRTALTRVSSSATQYVATGTPDAFNNSTASDTLSLTYTSAGSSKTGTLFNNSTSLAVTPGLIANIVDPGKSIATPTVISSSTTNIDFKPDGTVMYYTYSNQLYQLTLSTPWDISTASWDGIPITIGASNLIGVQFSNDGTKFYTLGTSSLRQYNLSTPWLLSSLNTTAAATLSVGTSPSDFQISSNGQYVYVLTAPGYTQVEQYTLGTPWSLSTAGTNINSQTTLNNFGEFFVTSNGRKMYFYENGNLKSFTFATPFIASTIVLDGDLKDITGSSGTVASGEFVGAAGGYLGGFYINENYDFYFVDAWNYGSSIGRFRQGYLTTNFYNPFTTTESPSGTYTINFQTSLPISTYTLQYGNYTRLPNTVTGTENFTTPANVLYQNDIAKLIFDERSINTAALNVKINTGANAKSSFVTDLKLNLRKSL